MLGRYTFDPVVRVQSGAGARGRLVSFVKRAIQPLAVWQLRHLTDQLNAYHLAHTQAYPSKGTHVLTVKGHAPQGGGR